MPVWIFVSKLLRKGLLIGSYVSGGHDPEMDDARSHSNPDTLLQVRKEEP